MGLRDLFQRWFRRGDGQWRDGATGSSRYVRPPADWADEAGWDRYNAAARRDVHMDMIGLRYVTDLRDKGFKRVWFPGCGTSWIPRLFTEIGFDVLATDISNVAVAAQEELIEAPLPTDTRKALDTDYNGRTPTRLQVRRHDFRTALDAESFDVVLNVRAFQGLSRDDKVATAKSHFTAVRPGGWSIFDTVNVQGEHRNELEDALEAAGYELPVRDATRWYRATLKATGIDYIEILGRPRGGAADEQARLDAIAAEYAARAERDYEATRARLESPAVKLAQVVYTTG